MTQDSAGDGIERTRRAVLRASAALLGAGAAGTAAGRPDNPIRGAGAPYDLDDGPFRNAEAVGYHSIGGVGPASRSGHASQRNDHDRNIAIDVHGDLAAVSFLQSGAEDGGRRLAILDVTEFDDATSEAELADAELRVLAIHRTANTEANSAHAVRFSADGECVFLATAAFLPFTDGYHGGSEGGADPADPETKPQVSGGVVAFDVSDPTDPAAVDSLTAPFTTGAIGLDYQRIDGTEYIFATKDFGFFAPDSGVFVLQFDREAGKLSVVNRWTADGNTARGEVGTEHGVSYVADVAVHEDPRTGRPTAYVADWNRGMRVLDVSDPTDIAHVGQFDALQTKDATPFPGLVEMPDGDRKRVAVANHEEYDERFDQRDDRNFMNPHPEKTNPNSTGTVFLVDCDGIYPAESGHDGEEPAQLGELDNWTWANVDTDPDVGFEDIRFKRRHLSPHSATVSRHGDGDDERFVVHQSHFHGGVRYLEVRPGTDDGLTEADGTRRDVRPTVNPHFEEREGEAFGWINETTDWSLVDVGHARPQSEVIEEETAPGRLTPRATTAAVSGGVTFAADQFAGARAVRHETVPLSPPMPVLSADRTYGAGPTRTTSVVEIDISALARDGDAATVRVRDRIPDGWTLINGDVETYPQGVRTAAEFERSVAPGEDATLSYRVKTPDDGVTSGTFGPVEVSVDGDEWVELTNTVEDVTAGPSL